MTTSSAPTLPASADPSPEASAVRPAVQLNYGQLPRTPQPDQPPPWERPADWLPLPAINPGEQKLVGLFAVYPGPGNVLALRASGNYTVDWGDGTTTAVSSPGEVIKPHTYWFANNFYGPLERMSLANPGDNHWIKRIEGTFVAYRNGTILDSSAYRVEVNPSTNNVEMVLTPPVPDGEFANLQVRWDWGETVVESVVAEHRYSYDALPASSQCSRGYRQVIVTLTPQAGSDLTLVDLSPRHSSISQDDASCPWLELAISLPRAQIGPSLVLCGYERYGTWDYLGSVERIVIQDAGGATNFRWLLYYASSLRVFELHRAEALEAIDGMFGNCSSLDHIRLPALPQLSSASELLYGATALRELRLSGLANITSLEGMCQDATGLERVWIEDAPRLTSTASLFQGCSNLRQVSLSGAPRVSDMSSMFAGCSSLINAPELETTAVTTMASMFEDCTSLRHVPHYDTTGVRSMAWMFNGCWALAQIPAFDTRLLESMEGMFSSCYALTTIPLLQLASVGSMSSTFSGCYALLQLPPLQVEGVSDFGGCFSSCVSLAAAPLEGIRQPVSFWGCALSRNAIVAIFQRLAVVSSNPSLDISENWGTRDLSADDLAIATAKGWTVLY